ncbi:MAG: hypothetical protein LBJ00_02175 [Planctomycetaceae bacterium]|nr:hypothetical protein [Planctomycetaceae bacterium]
MKRLFNRPTGYGINSRQFVWKFFYRKDEKVARRFFNIFFCFICLCGV